MTTREVLKTIKHEEGIKILNLKKSDKEVYDILVAKGLTDSFEIFTSEAKKVFNENVSKMSQKEILTQFDGAELTEEQLEAVAGGINSGNNGGFDINMVGGGANSATSV